MESMSRQQEVDENYEAFKAMLPELMRTHPNKFALMHNKEVVACFDTSRDAIAAGNNLIDGHFSVQQITDRSIDLGYFSHLTPQTANTQALEFDAGKSIYQGLIGRDILRYGVLILSMDGHYSFSY